jgi:hypothetical protein
MILVSQNSSSFFPFPLSSFELLGLNDLGQKKIMIWEGEELKDFKEIQKYRKSCCLRRGIKFFKIFLKMCCHNDNPCGHKIVDVVVRWS